MLLDLVALLVESLFELIFDQLYCEVLLPCQTAAHFLLELNLVFVDLALLFHDHLLMSLYLRLVRIDEIILLLEKLVLPCLLELAYLLLGVLVKLLKLGFLLILVFHRTAVIEWVLLQIAGVLEKLVLSVVLLWLLDAWGLRLDLLIEELVFLQEVIQSLNFLIV